MDKKKYILVFVIFVLVVGGGIFAWQYFSTLETKDWKIYKNEQYGFEIKYPQGWYYGENNYTNQQMICLNPEGLAGDCTAILTISWDTELQERYAAMKQLFEKDYTVTESIVSIAGAEGKLLTIGNTSGFTRSLFFEKNGYVYNFAVRATGYENLFNQMLATFKFLGLFECSSLMVAGYNNTFPASQALYNKNFNGEIEIALKDLTGDFSGKEIVEAYMENTGTEERIKPIIVKIFFGTKNCPKEVFSYTGEGNLIGNVQSLYNFWGDGPNAVLVEEFSYAGGSGSKVSLLFFTHRDGKYSLVKGPTMNGFWKYKFDGSVGLGRKVITADDVFEEGDCGTCAHKMKFTIYNWNGKEYIKTEAGLTSGKYFGESIDEILQKEPSVLPLETATWQVYRNEEYGFEIKYPRGWKMATNFPGRLGPGQTKRREGIDPKSFNFALNSKDLTIEENGDINLYVAPFGVSCVGIADVNTDTISEFLRQNKYYKDEIEFCKSATYFRFFLKVTPQKEIFHQMLSTFKFIK